MYLGNKLTKKEIQDYVRTNSGGLLYEPYHKGGFSKVITKLNKFHYIFFIIEILVYRYGKLNINKIKKYMQ